MKLFPYLTVAATAFDGSGEPDILESNLEVSLDCDTEKVACPAGQFNWNDTCYRIDYCANPAIHNCNSSGQNCALVETFPFFECRYPPVTPKAPTPKDPCSNNPCGHIAGNSS